MAVFGSEKHMVLAALSPVLSAFQGLKGGVICLLKLIAHVLVHPAANRVGGLGWERRLGARVPDWISRLTFVRREYRKIGESCPCSGHALLLL